MAHWLAHLCAELVNILCLNPWLVYMVFCQNKIQNVRCFGLCASQPGVCAIKSNVQHSQLVIQGILYILAFHKFYRLIKHTERLLEEKEEKLCIKVLQTLKEMMTIDIDYGEKVCDCCIRDYFMVVNACSH